MKQIASILLIVLFISGLYSGVFASDGKVEKPMVDNNASAVSIVAEMSDEQVRHLLIETLRKEALALEKESDSLKGDVGGFVSFIQQVKEKVSFFRGRIEFLKSGEKSNIQEMKGLFAFLGKGRAEPLPTSTLFYVFALFGLAYAIDLLFRRYSRPLVSISAEPGKIFTLRSKTGRLVLKLGIDVISTLIFIVVTLLCFYLLFEPTHGLRVILATYLIAIVAVRIVLMISRFFLVPKDSDLRFLPISTPNAQFLYRWIAAISILASFGLMTCGIIRLSGASEANHVKSILILAVITTGMLIVMVLQKKKEVAAALTEKLSPDSQLAKLVRSWHHIAIFFIFVLFVLSFWNIISGDTSSHLSLKTLLMVPAYFISDWILRQILNTLFGFLPEQEEEPGKAEIIDDKIQEEKMFQKQIEFNRMKKIIVFSLRTSLALLFIIWIFNIWGVDLPIGKAVAKAIFNILIVVMLCYIVWEFLNAAIQKRLSIEMPDEEEEMEEGGAGGSRIGTLLLLLRKFLMGFIIVIAVMVILSSMGVNIGPLIAGAGVIGLAIGFGAQTLVKDIISGIFFLIDDAFRVGDYIVVGSTKGMVEHISIRSFKLRHPRGMVNTIPFGDIATVTNFSRDYIISKLDFRVKYGTDVEKVRKIIKKKVYKVILKNEKLAPKLLGKIKSQGVRRLEDSAMIMRVKFKTIPGEQFGIRKEVFRLLQEAFEAEGIEFAHRNVTVYIPPGNSGESAEGDTDRKKLIEAGAAAAAAEDEAEQAEEKK